MRIKYLFPVSLLLTLVPWGAFAECEAPYVPAFGDFVFPRTELEVLGGRFPTSGFISFFPPLHGVIKVVPEGEKLRVVDVFLAASLFYDSYYLRVEFADAPEDHSCRSSYCWVFQGYAGSESPPNMVPGCWE